MQRNKEFFLFPVNSPLPKKKAQPNKHKQNNSFRRESACKIGNSCHSN